MNILMVCMGNICRSPMAEGIARHLLTRYRIPDVQVDSAAAHAYHIGSPPDARACAVMKKHGIAIEHLRARAFSDHDFARFDVILVADAYNRHRISRRAGNAVNRAKIALMLETLPEAPGSDLPDPYYGNEQDFEQTYQLLDRALRARFGISLTD